MTRRSRAPDGFLILNKPSGITSFEALSAIKRAFNTSRVGHAGTLDRFASGVLVVLVGRYSRLSEFFTASRKTYRAGIRFGSETDTLDPEGNVTAEAAAPSIDALRGTLSSFLGDILQAPPAYSAVHIDGKRAYERALEGEKVEPAPRPVRIDALDLLSYEEGLASVRVVCSKGTYIRSLARDLALACGSRAHLETLVREVSGPFRVEDGFDSASVEERLLRTIDPRLSADLGLEPLYLSGGQESYFLRGAPLSKGRFTSFPEKDGLFAVFSTDERFWGVVEKKDGWFSYKVVLGSVEDARP